MASHVRPAFLLQVLLTDLPMDHLQHTANMLKMHNLFCHGVHIIWHGLFSLLDLTTVGHNCYLPWPLQQVVSYAVIKRTTVGRWRQCTHSSSSYDGWLL